jgi:hypothetical protein
VEAALSYIDSTIFTVLGKVAAQVFSNTHFLLASLKKMFSFQFTEKKAACLTKVLANIIEEISITIGTI